MKEHPQYLYWQHKESRAVFACRFNEIGEVTRAVGPLSATEVKPKNLPKFDYHEEGVRLGELIEANRDEYRLYLL